MDERDPNKKKFRAKRVSVLTPASDVLRRLLENSKLPLTDQFNCLKMAGKWTTIVGDTIGKHSEPAGFKMGTLYVWVENSTWLHELTYFAPHVLDRVNTFLGKVWAHKVRFVLNKNQVPDMNEHVRAQTAKLESKP